MRAPTGWGRATTTAAPPRRTHPRAVELRRMSAEAPARPDPGTAIARWIAKALLIAAGVLLVGGVIWYARSATVPLIVAALVSTQLLPLVGWATSHGVRRGLAIAVCPAGCCWQAAARRCFCP